MKGDWGDDTYNTRLELRSKIYELYKTLPYCPPKRSKRQYTLHSNEYEDSEAISNRDDLSNCPERDEPFTETDNNLNEPRIPQNEMYKEVNRSAIDNYKPYLADVTIKEEELTNLENHFLKKLKGIDEQINELQKQSPDTSNYKQERKTIIDQLDNVEKEIMTQNWDVYRFTIRRNFRPLIYRLYKKINYCAPKRDKRQYEQEKYEDPEEILDRENFQIVQKKTNSLQKRITI